MKTDTLTLDGDKGLCYSPAALTPCKEPTVLIGDRRLSWSLEAAQPEIEPKFIGFPFYITTPSYPTLNINIYVLYEYIYIYHILYRL
jgi:hypothetical protein